VFFHIIFSETAERNRVKVGGMEMERVGEKSKRSRILLIGSISYLLTVQMTILFDKLPCSVHKTGVFSCYIF
jgi:hypothetical protein